MNVSQIVHGDLESTLLAMKTYPVVYQTRDRKEDAVHDQTASEMKHYQFSRGQHSDRKAGIRVISNSNFVHFLIT